MEFQPVNPAQLADRISIFPLELQLLAVTTCAACREKHSGWCYVELCEGDGRCAANEALGTYRGLGHRLMG